MKPCDSVGRRKEAEGAPVLVKLSSAEAYAEDTAQQGAQQLQAGGSDVSSDEDAGETHPRSPAPTGELLHGPVAVAYQPSIGVDDAVIYLLHTAPTHLEKAGSTVRIMFFDFSSAFSTIQPRLLGDKLQVAGVDHHLTTWILSEGFERYFPTTKDP
ncbi:hypothetical protein D4764_0145670 [Takifugu flavidus]|uniref:Reverse transcriptase domain-containing protein n=1 Tax=Takifugu flavidus TaxID=433684 RepID=A0A5C6ML44_9TELE|nr:hypothetical protein D4764_0145670 [Takifugu flavidus]